MSPYRTTHERFINPYNFISINEDVETNAFTYGSLSGTMTCELETLTPLFIPNTTNSHAFTLPHNSDDSPRSYDFFSYEDLTKRGDCRQNPARPIIPGSSLRGAIRSAYEAALNGCLSTCDDENTLYRRTPVPREYCGIIEKEWKDGQPVRVLYKADKQEYPIGNRGKHQTGEFLKGGIYLRGENTHNKKYDAIMKYKDNREVETRFSEDRDEWKSFVEVWRLYQHRQGPIKGVNQQSQEKHSGYKGYLNAEKIPVYYTKLENGKIYLAPAMITKEVFSRTLKVLLQEQGGHAPCTDGKRLCPACALFGMIGDEVGKSRASRLMFKDAVPIRKEGISVPDDNECWQDWYEDVRTLPILGSPKVTATEFYMEDIDGTAYFNYDYSVKYYQDSEGKKPVRTFIDKPRLRGRKFYWHSQNVRQYTPSLKGKKPSNPAKMLTEIRPVKGKMTFKFDLAFDRLTPDELTTLLWVLTFGEHNATHAHKLGHGKPVGYGSVRITSTDIKLFTLHDNLSLTLAKAPADCRPKKPADSTALREYLRITDFSQAKDNVQYPIAEDKGDQSVYAWFSINKKITSSGVKPVFNYVLPQMLNDRLLPKDVSMPKYETGNGNIETNRQQVKFAAQAEKNQEEQKPHKSAPATKTIKEKEPGKDRGMAKKTGNPHTKKPTTEEGLR